MNRSAKNTDTTRDSFLCVERLVKVMTGEQSGPDFSDLYGDLSGIKSMHKAIEADKKALRKGTSLAEAYRPLGELNEVGTALKETKRATSGVKEFRKRVNACDTGEFTQAVDNATELSKELSGLNTGEFTQAVNNAAELSKKLSGLSTGELTNVPEAVQKAGKIQVPHRPEVAVDPILPTVDTALPPVSSFESNEPAPADTESVELTPDDLRGLMREAGELVECPGCGHQYLAENANFSTQNSVGLDDRDNLCSRCRDADRGFR